ncbi:LamG-like jellyroll fold domain-containing protein [Bacteroidota bacterium]
MRVKLFIVLLFSIFFSIQSFGQKNCLTFDGMDDHVDVANNSSINMGTNEFTVEFWVQPPASNPASSMAFISKMNSSNNIGWRIYLSSSGQISIRLNSINKYSSTSVCDGKWHHVAVVFTKELLGGIMYWYYTIFLDGSIVSKYLHIQVSSLSNADDLAIGYSPSIRYFYGKMDEIRIWNYALSESEIQTNLFYEIISPPSSLVAYYKLNESSGTTADNAEGTSALDGTLHNFPASPWVTSPFPFYIKTASGGSTWNNTSSWYGGVIPGSSDSVVIGHNLSISSNESSRSLRIETGATLTINSQGSLNVNGNIQRIGNIIVKSDASGNIGSFVNNGNIWGTGLMKVEKITSAGFWHYVSVPITSALAYDYFFNTALYYYDEPNGKYAPIKTNINLTIAKGYDLFFNGSAKTITFSGRYNTGNQSIGVTNGTGNGYNLVGNPYPSTIDWDASSGWTKTNVDAATYIWDPGSNNVATYVTGGGGATANGGTRYIPATQGFFITCSGGSTGTLGMTNAVRVTNAGPLRSTDISNSLKLKVSSNNKTDETVIRFLTNATDSFDGQYDAYKFFSYTNPQLYTISSDNKSLSINSIPEITEPKHIPLYLFPYETGLKKIDFDLSAFDPKYDVYFEDLFTNQLINLKSQNSYEFQAEKNNNHNRFMIHIIPVQSISNPNYTSDTNKINLYTTSIPGDLYINNEELKNYSEIIIHDLLGHEVYKTIYFPTQFAKINPGLPFGVYIVQLIGKDGIFTKKVQLN